jgi:hypothetical protein
MLIYILSFSRKQQSYVDFTTITGKQIVTSLSKAKHHRCGQIGIFPLIFLGPFSNREASLDFDYVTIFHFDRNQTKFNWRNFTPPPPFNPAHLKISLSDYSKH